MEIVNIDFGGWDTHSSQGVYAGGPTGTGMHDNMSAPAGDLRAFYDDMKNSGRKFAVLVTTEFGRSVLENANAETDHGKAGVAMVMGSKVNGGQLCGTWPGLAPAQLNDRDVMVTTDIRDVPYEIADKALINPNPASDFKSLDPRGTRHTNEFHHATSSVSISRSSSRHKSTINARRFE